MSYVGGIRQPGPFAPLGLPTRHTRVSLARVKRLLLPALLIAALAFAGSAEARSGYTVIDYGKRELFAARGIVPGGGGSSLLSLSVGAQDDQLMGVLKIDKRGRVVKGFGRHGIATARTGSGYFEDTASLVRLPDGRIVVTGTSSGNGPFAQQAIGLAAFKSNGARGGTARFAFEDVSTVPNFIVTRPGGGFAVGGMGFVGPTPYACLAAFTPSLKVDPAYDSKCEVPQGATSAYFVDGLALPDGSIIGGVATTHLGRPPDPNGEGESGQPVLGFGVSRTGPDGKRDPGFGESNGWTFSRVGDKECDGERPDARSIAPRAGGGWIVGGGLACQTGLVAFTASGAVDTSFGKNGRVTTDLDPGRGVELMTGLVRMPDGGFAGIAGRLGGRDLLVGRWKANGTPDRSFDGDGRLRLRTANVLGYDFRYNGGIQARPGGGLLVTVTVSTPPRRFAAIALNRRGKLDHSFGAGSARVR